MDFIIVFNNTTEAVSTEDFFNKNNIPNRVMPTPTNIAKSCGISLIVRNEDISIIKELKSENKISVKGIYKRTSGTYEILEG
ncbi:MAG: DUF3343 domain-containing protein [Clostridiaceae bacterium]